MDRGERKGNGNMRDRNDSIRGRIQTESNERGILIEGTIMELGRNLMPGKFPGMYKQECSKLRLLAIVGN